MYRELGKWLLDIAKYVATAIVIAGWLRGFETWDWYLGLVVMAIVAVIVWLSLQLIDYDDKIKHKKGGAYDRVDKQSPVAGNSLSVLRPAHRSPWQVLHRLPIPSAKSLNVFGSTTNNNHIYNKV